jgi:hypothetical protein
MEERFNAWIDGESYIEVMEGRPFSRLCLGSRCRHIEGFAAIELGIGQ